MHLKMATICTVLKVLMKNIGFQVGYKKLSSGREGESDTALE
tara:strand:- start:699 stop:824 length:126 start_codon:yes stop_codon:yes gene_type:complete